MHFSGILESSIVSIIKCKKFYHFANGKGLNLLQEKITMLTFLVKKSKMKLSGVSFFLEHAQKV